LRQRTPLPTNYSCFQESVHRIDNVREKGEGRREKGEGRREKGEGRREKGEGRREKGVRWECRFRWMTARGLTVLQYENVEGA
jgi:hypothetical protein